MFIWNLHKYTCAALRLASCLMFKKSRNILVFILIYISFHAINICVTSHRIWISKFDQLSKSFHCHITFSEMSLIGFVFESQKKKDSYDRQNTKRAFFALFSIRWKYWIVWRISMIWVARLMRGFEITSTNITL